MTNSTIQFKSGSGIVIDDGGTTGSGSYLGSLVLAADFVSFQGLLQAERVDEIVLTGGKGTASAVGTAVSFTGTIKAKTIGNVSLSASSGDIVFDPRLG
jgi:L-aminopeptidase/D-esterase-like protein